VHSRGRPITLRGQTDGNDVIEGAAHVGCSTP
jgi:hypothetical protein